LNDEHPLVVDAVVHPYDLSERNRQAERATQLEAVYGAHTMATPDGRPAYELTRDEFFSDFPFEAMAWSLFVESDVDLAFLHSLPNLGFTHGPVTDPDRAAEFRDRHPQRIRLYATVDTPVTDDAIAQLERQVREHRVDGLKLYPSFFYDGTAQGWRLDAPDFAIPLLEAARDLGVHNVAIHKALWLDPAPRAAFSPTDMHGALERFDDINFYMIHAGMAFVDETVDLLRNHDNLHATLESTLAYALVRPRLFAEVFSRLLEAAGPDRLLWGSGTNLMHPWPILEAFRSFTVPQDLLDQGYPQLSEEGRRAILGGNVLRLHGIESATARTEFADDEFALARQRLGGREEVPWRVLRRDTTTESTT
jgi:uncharacterized protein